MAVWTREWMMPKCIKHTLIRKCIDCGADAKVSFMRDTHGRIVHGANCWECIRKEFSKTNSVEHSLGQ